MSRLIATIDDFEKVSKETLDSLNPLKFESSPVEAELSTPEGIIGRVLTFIFPIAGLILFSMIVAGGVEMMMGAADKKSIENGKNRVTAAIVGFILLFSSYWLVQVVELVFGIDILGL